MTYEEIKILAETLFGQYISKGFINTTSGSPTAIALLLHLAGNRIAGMPEELECLKETGTITLTGATSYNFRTSYPDFRSVYQVYGINENQAHPFVPNYEANVIPAQAYSIRGITLYFSGTAPTSGTLRFQYKSQYMVKSAAGVRKRYFEADDDYSVLDDVDINALIFGLGDFVQWKTDIKSKDRKEEVKTWHAEAIQNIINFNVNTKQLDNSVGMLG